MEKITYHKNNLILNPKNKFPLSKKNALNSNLNIYLFKNKNKATNEDNNKNEYDKIDINNKNEDYDSELFHKDFKNKTININKNINNIIKKGKSCIFQPIKNLNINYKDIGKSSYNKSNDNLLNSDDNNEIITSKKKQDINVIKNIDNTKNQDASCDNDSYINKNIAEHNVIITDLLNKTENYFSKLGLYLYNKNNKDSQYFDIMKDYYKIKVKKIFNSPKENDDKNDMSYTKKKINFKFYNNLKNIKENNIKHCKSILDNYIEGNNNLKKKSNLKKNFSFYNNSQNIEFNIINNNSKILKNNQNNHFNKNNKKLFMNDIIQTFNIEKNNELNIDQDKQANIEQNNILPILSTSMEKIDHFSNKIKIAEIRQIYPITCCKKKPNLIPLNNNKYKNNSQRKVLLDIKDNFVKNYKYNYEQIMNKIRYGIMNKKGFFANIYKNKYNSSDRKKIIYSKLKKITKIDK